MSAKIYKHPAIWKKKGGGRILDDEEKEALRHQSRILFRCNYGNFRCEPTRTIGHYKTLLCEEHYQKLRNAK